MNDLWHIVQANSNFSSKELKVYIIPHWQQCAIIKKVSKGAWRMPWLSEAMKDVISCDKLRGGANNLWSEDFRMGQPNILKRYYPTQLEANAGNWNILVPAGKENNNDSPSSGERTGNSPNRLCYGITGVVGLRHCMKTAEKNFLERKTIEHDSCVFECCRSIVVSWVARSTRNSAWICRDPVSYTHLRAHET